MTGNGRAAAQALQRHQTDFLDMAAHQLYTPLTPILVDLQLLDQRLGGDRDDDTRRILERMRRNAERLRGVVEDISNSSHLQSNTVMRPETCDLVEIAREVVAAFKDHAAARQVRLTIHATAPLPVHADPAGLQHVAHQLVGNAIRFTPAGGRVEVEVEDSDGRPTLHVRDTGVGLDAAQRERMFVPFSQPNDPVRQEAPGHGLGLFVSRLIAEAHHGELTIGDRDGRGADFRLTLPSRRAVGTQPISAGR